MDYYNSNAIYDHLKLNNSPQFSFVVGNSWQLVYGDNNCKPLVLVFAVGVPLIQIDNPPSEEDKMAFSLMKTLSEKSNLPLKYIRFASDVNSIEDVRVSDTNFNYLSLTMSELSELFESFGLPVSNTHTGKYLNDKTSSAYHKWQRSSLGRALTVSDIDMWGIDVSKNPRVIFELKRSFYDLGRWKPFNDDYRNFKLISNLCNKSGMKFGILYNQRIKNPFQDIISSMKLFTVDFSKTPPISEGKIISLERFNNAQFE